MPSRLQQLMAEETKESAAAAAADTSFSSCSIILRYWAKPPLRQVTVPPLQCHSSVQTLVSSVWSCVTRMTPPRHRRKGDPALLSPGKCGQRLKTEISGHPKAGQVLPVVLLALSRRPLRHQLQGAVVEIELVDVMLRKVPDRKVSVGVPCPGKRRQVSVRTEVHLTEQDLIFRIAKGNLIELKQRRRQRFRFRKAQHHHRLRLHLLNQLLPLENLDSTLNQRGRAAVDPILVDKLLHVLPVHLLRFVVSLLLPLLLLHCRAEGVKVAAVRLNLRPMNVQDLRGNAGEKLAIVGDDQQG
ncbi:hypothetical protein TYRP_017062 [Tyrophagus putrescentiae]|nr:hypothetical protein TYRP_017062 [Tyrophagus putrescentiae]